jgi:demethylmenaquinone methyltransferase/2-methoxy-6-polyprenyl-1,4-benzoquinol methylase
LSAVDKHSQGVRRMFASIAPRYDLLNHLLSLNIDRRWRRRLAQGLQDLNSGARVLDVCTGTGDLALELSKGRQVIGIDFCHPMLVIARDKIRRVADGPALAEADALSLPFGPGTFDAVTVAFGARNLESLQRGLQEFRRVLSPGGRLSILEFSSPRNALFRRVFQLYFHYVLPAVGALVSGVDGPYRYLPASVREFPDQERFGKILEECGFESIRWEDLSGGIAALHTARKPAGGVCSCSGSPLP